VEYIIAMEGRTKILLHVCCGVCATSVVERLCEEGFEVTAFFYNPNIHPPEEYERRLKTFLKVAEIMNFPYLIGEYEVEKWWERIKGLEKEPEGGKRCEVCFQLRIEETYRIAKEMDFPFFTTTLTVSPHKKAEVINRIGKEIGEERFLIRDFKKKEGFKRAIQLSKEFSLYRQNYCGCIFSKR